MLRDLYIVASLSKKKEEEKQREEKQQARNGYWQNELDSLGRSEPKLNKKKELKEHKLELESLSNFIKQRMFEGYKLAYSEKGEAHKEDVQSTVTVG